MNLDKEIVCHVFLKSKSSKRRVPDLHSMKSGAKPRRQNRGKGEARAERRQREEEADP